MMPKTIGVGLLGSRTNVIVQDGEMRLRLVQLVCWSVRKSLNHDDTSCYMWTWKIANDEGRSGALEYLLGAD